MPPFSQGVDLLDGENALPFCLEDYMELIDWTGRAARDDKRGSIPEHIPKILHHIGLSENRWLTFVSELEKRFTHAVGSKERLLSFAEACNVKWLRGQTFASRIYV